MTFSFILTESISEEPGFYEGHFYIDPTNEVRDTFISFRGWSKGIAFVNNFNIGRFWPVIMWIFCYKKLNMFLILLCSLTVLPHFSFLSFLHKNVNIYLQSFGPQCTLYVPAPILQHGANVVVRET